MAAGRLFYDIDTGVSAALVAAAQIIMVVANHYLKNALYDFSVYSVMLIAPQPSGSAGN